MADSLPFQLRKNAVWIFFPKISALLANIRNRVELTDVTNALAYYGMQLIMVVKKFIVHTLGWAQNLILFPDLNKTRKTNS